MPVSNVEFVLYGQIGKPKFTTTKSLFCGFQAKCGAHNEKPVEFYDTLRWVTQTPRIDMFARRDIEGFANWGNEV